MYAIKFIENFIFSFHVSSVLDCSRITFLTKAYSLYDNQTLGDCANKSFAQICYIAHLYFPNLLTGAQSISKHNPNSRLPKHLEIAKHYCVQYVGAIIK